MFQVMAIGETMALVTPVDASPLDSAEHFRLDAGGAESTVAQYLQDLGHRSAWVSRLGDDPLGRRVLQSVQRSGVDTSWVVLDPTAPTGVYFKDPGRHGTTVHYYRKGSAASLMSAADLARLPLADVRVIHISGITAALSESCYRLIRSVLERPEAGDTLVSFDVNYRQGLWDVERAAPILLDLAQRADIVFVGRDEAETLWNTTTAEQVRDMLPQPRHLVVKDGAVGATEFGVDGAVFVPAQRVAVVESVGAGDAFAAGYLAGLLDGDSPSERLAGGHRLAARTLTSTGDYVPLNGP